MDRRRFLFGIACLVAAFVFLTAGLTCHRKGEGFLRGFTFVSASEWDGEQIRPMMGGSEPLSADEPENAYSFAAWTQISGESVSVAGGATTEVDVTAVCGPSECVFACGHNLSADDEEGCIVGKGLAEQLFGGYRVEGQKIAWRDREWTVRGVVEEPSDLMLTQTYDMEEIMYDRISVLLPDGAGRRREGETFAASYGIDGRAVRWDYLYGYDWMVEMIPGKWSDFEGWKENLKEYRKGRALAESMGKSLIEMTGLRYIQRGIILVCLGMVFCVGAEIAFLGARRYNHQKSWK